MAGAVSAHSEGRLPSSRVTSAADALKERQRLERLDNLKSLFFDIFGSDGRPPLDLVLDYLDMVRLYVMLYYI